MKTLRNIIAPILLLLAALPAATAAEEAGWRNRFPYVHQPVPFYRKYESLRDVERPREAITYLRKRKQMVPHSSAEIECYFARRNRAAAADLDLSDTYDLEGRDACIVGAVGDIMCIPNGSEDCLRPGLLRHLAACDLLMGNLETPVVPGQPTGMFYRGSLRFNSDPALLDTLATGGQGACGIDVAYPLFDVISVANNHSLDRWEAGLATTVCEVSRRGMIPLGVARCGPRGGLAGRYTLLERGGLKIAVTAFSYGVNSMAWKGPVPPQLNVMSMREEGVLPDFRLFERIVAEARREGADLIVASVHWGYEWEFYPDPHTMVVARELAARGADLIVGHHPHVLKPLEVLHVNVESRRGTTHYVEDRLDPTPRACLVAYSLGDLTTPEPSPANHIGGLLAVEVRRATHRASGNRRGLVTGASLTPIFTRIEGRGQRERVSVLDLVGCLDGRCGDDALAREAFEACAAADLDRLGAPWLNYHRHLNVYRPAGWQAAGAK